MASRSDKFKKFLASDMALFARRANRDDSLRFVIYRPHANIWFKDPVGNILKGQRLPNKYGSLLDHLLARGIAISFTTSFVAPPPKLKAWMRFLLEPLELLLWCVLNHIELRRVGFIFRGSALRERDVLLVMHYGNLTHEDEAAARAGARIAARLANVRAAKVVHMTHFAYWPQTGAANLAAVRPDLLVAENDLSRNSPFFAKYFGSSEAAFQTLPYVAAARFVKTTPFESRTHKVVATGSVTFRMRDPEFRTFYGGDELQPLRRALYENSAQMSDQVECLISDLNASRAPTAPSTPSSGAPLAFLRRKRHPQAGYYRKNIVSVYNSYTMFVVSEEICDLPAIGFVEGMACGCVYLGVEGPMYADIGMVPGVHYIGYDGSLGGLVDTARHYQQPAQLEALAAVSEAGRRFVTETLSPDRIYSAFAARLQVMVSARGHG